MSYRRILLYNLIGGSYDRIQQIIIITLDLVQFHLNMMFMFNMKYNYVF